VPQLWTATSNGESINRHSSVLDLHREPETISEHKAKYLLIQNHSAVELVDRMERLDLLQRAADPDDGRRILVRLSAEGERRLKKLSKTHLEELSAAGTALSNRLAHFRDQQE